MKQQILEIEKKLKEPFPEKDILWRISRKDNFGEECKWAIILAYVDARAVRDRLDEAFGITNWREEYIEGKGGTFCKLDFRCLDNSEWIQRMDGSQETQVEAFKGGISKSLVRAAASLGIGRYLYGLGTTFAIKATKEYRGDKRLYLDRDTKNAKGFGYWIAPDLPSWALPKKEDSEEEKEQLLGRLRKIFKELDDQERLDAMNLCGIEDLSAFKTMESKDLADCLRILDEK